MKPKKAPKLRLNQDKRERLLDHAVSLLSFPELEKAVEDARAPLLIVVLEAAESQWPENELKVLRKWGKTSRVDSVQLALDGGKPYNSAIRDSWSSRKTVLLNIPGGIELPEHKRHIFVEPGVWSMHDAYGAAKQALESARLKTKIAYRQLMANARYLEDITPHWPEAEKLAVELGRKPQPLMRIQGAFLDIVKADVAKRQSAAL